MGMIWPEVRLVDLKRAAYQRLGLGGPVCDAKQFRQIGKAHGDIGMLWAQGLLIDCNRAAYQRLGLSKPVRGLK